MLTPMLVQYLIGLCCLRRNPDAVDITVGDMVLDTAAGKRRDVDITVTLQEEDGSVSAFKAFEVKREGEPLDVATVEQLCMKFADMPTVTHRAIVSASGFTKGAIAKATAHNVQLLVFKPWTLPLSDQFPAFENIGAPSEFLRGVQSNFLCWVGWKLSLVVSKGPSSFNWDSATPAYATNGNTHSKYATLGDFSDSLLYRSTGILFTLERAQTIARSFPPHPVEGNNEIVATPPWPHTHTLGVVDDQIFMKFGSEVGLVSFATISGSLQWQKRKRIPEFHVLEQLPTGEAFAGAAIADWGSGDGRLMGLIFSPHSRAIDVHPV